MGCPLSSLIAGRDSTSTKPAPENRSLYALYFAHRPPRYPPPHNPPQSPPRLTSEHLAYSLESLSRISIHPYPPPGLLLTSSITTESPRITTVPTRTLSSSYRIIQHNVQEHIAGVERVDWIYE